MRANTGPMDLSYLLKRRRVAFDRWCLEHGITTKEHFETVKKDIEAHGEFFLGEEMTQKGLALPEKVLVAAVEEEVPAEASEDLLVVEPAEVQEETTKKPRNKKV